MVERNNAEERLARIEHMVEALQRETAARKRKATTLNVVVAGALMIANVAAALLPVHTSRKA